MKLLLIAWSVLAGGIINALADDGAPAGPNSVSINEVTQAWLMRQRSASTVDFSWSAHKFQSGAYSSAPTALRGKRSDLPPDATYESRTHVVFDDRGRITFDDEDRSWDADKRAYVPKKCIDAFDTKNYITFYPYGTLPFPNGHVQPVTSADTGRHYKLFALRLCFRPFDQRMGMFDTDSLSPSARAATAKGDRVMVLTRRDGQTQESVWVDPGKDFVPVHYSKASNGRDRWVVDVDYVKDASHGWVPKAWSITCFDRKDGGILFSESATVSAYAINASLAPSTFTVAFPVGTFVHDYIKDELYIIQAENKFRPVLPGEYTGRNYQALLNSESRNGGITTAWRAWLVAANIAIVVILFGALLYRRARASRA